MSDVRKTLGKVRFGRGDHRSVGAPSRIFLRNGFIPAFPNRIHETRHILKRLSRILLLLILFVLPVQAGPVETAFLQADPTRPLPCPTWQFHAGDDPAWALPTTDTRNWPALTIYSQADLRKTCDDRRMTWHRLEIRIPPGTQREMSGIPFGLLVPRVRGLATEIFANGTRVGSFGSFDPTPVAYTETENEVVTIPASLIGTDGRLVVAIRRWVNPLPSGKLRVFADIQFGFLPQVEAKARELRDARLFADLPVFFCALFGVAVGLFYLQLWISRRSQREYLWFCTVSLATAFNMFFLTTWCEDWLSFTMQRGLSQIFMHAAALCGIEFLCEIFHLRRNRWLKVFQFSQLACMALIPLAPGIFLFGSVNSLRYTLSTLIFAAIALRTLFRQLRKGNREARTLFAGLSCILFSVLCQVTLIALPYSTPLKVTLFLTNAPNYGLTFFIFSMAVMLSTRFVRAYNEIDTLNRDLELRVEERTNALADKNRQLQTNLRQLDAARNEAEVRNVELNRKNAELLESKQQADRIFSALAEALPGTILDGKYRLDEKIGSGGFGAVFKATHLGLNRPIAVKVFKPIPGNDSANAVERFKLEGISVARLNHPNIINVIDSGISHEGIAYLVMELLQGHTLYDEVSRKRPLPLRRCIQVLVPVCQALAEAHRNGIIHRDIKPSNIFINRNVEGETVKVVDFGTAKLLDASGSEEYERLTATGALIGTPNYISPERIGGMDYDGRSDVYSVGVMFYQMLCGRVPFQSSEGNSMSVLYAHLNTPPPSPRTFNPAIAPEVEAAALLALEKSPEDRPGAVEFAAMLEALWEFVGVEDLSESDTGWFQPEADPETDYPTFGSFPDFDQAPLTQKYSGIEDRTAAFPTATMNDPTLVESSDSTGRHE
jgi:serine/threonine protein kinase